MAMARREKRKATEHELTGGLYGKFLIERADGEEMPEGAQYFVLRYDHKGDWKARAALALYARLCSGWGATPTGSRLGLELSNDVAHAGRLAGDRHWRNPLYDPRVRVLTGGNSRLVSAGITGIILIATVTVLAIAQVLYFR